MFGKKTKPEPQSGPLLRPVATKCSYCFKEVTWLLEVPKVCPTCQQGHVVPHDTGKGERS
jgi:hypothetical protein